MAHDTYDRVGDPMTDTPKQRRTRKPVEVRRREVLDATLTLVARGGFGVLNMEAIAREVGLSKPVVYAAYPDLEQLVAALVDREQEALLESMQQVAERAREHDAPSDRVMAWLAGMAALIMANPDPWVVMLIRPEDSPLYLRERIRAGRDELRETLAHALRVEEDTERVYGSPDADLVTHGLLAIAEQFSNLLLVDPETYPIDRLLRFASAITGRLVVD